MSFIICARPECQISAGCKCATVWHNPAPHAVPAIPNQKVLEGIVISAMPDLATRATSIICGHDFIQRLSGAEHAQFEAFVKDVLRTKYL